MKKIVLLLLAVASLVFILVSCSNSSKTNDNYSSENGNGQLEYENTAPVGNASHQEYVTTSFSAIQGAVIYDLTYDSNGYLQSCHFHKKCEACGDVSNSNGSTSDNLTTSYHCAKCGNDQRVEIEAIKTWVEIPN